MCNDYMHACVACVLYMYMHVHLYYTCTYELHACTYVMRCVHWVWILSLSPYLSQPGSTAGSAGMKTEDGRLEELSRQLDLIRRERSASVYMYLQYIIMSCIETVLWYREDESEVYIHVHFFRCGRELIDLDPPKNVLGVGIHPDQIDDKLYYSKAAYLAVPNPMITRAV